MRFPAIRLIVLGLVFLSQIYLCLRIRQAVQSIRRSDEYKRRLLWGIGGVFGLLFTINTYMLFVPVVWVEPPLAVLLGLFYPVAVWNFGSLFSAALLCVARTAGTIGRAALRLRRPRRVPGTPVDQVRRRLLQAGVGSLAGAPILLSGYGAAYAAKAYDVRELTLPFGRRLRVVQLTDIHAGIYMRRDEIRRYAGEANRLQPDLLVLTGDFISNAMSYLPGCLAEMARIRASLGTFATLGNHEHMYGQPEEIQAVFREYGIPLLHNAHRIISTPGGSVAVVGVDDIQWGDPDLEVALRGLDPAIPRLLLSHRPEIFPAAAERRIPLTLAGHWHGGQVTLRLPGAAVSFAHFRTPYPEGLYRLGISHLYVSRGIGTTATPVRLNAPPEVTLFHLT